MIAGIEQNPAQTLARRRSLSLRLLLIFLFTGLLLLVLLHSAFRGAAQSEVAGLIRQSIAEYSLYLAGQIGSPADYGSARRIAERTRLAISIDDERGFWSTDPRREALQDIRFRPTDYPQVSYRFVRGDLHIRVNTEVATVYFSARHRPRLSEAGAATWLPLGLMLVVIWCSYQLVKRLFSPINAMHQAALRFGNGELQHRIAVRRDDELGQLSAVFNQMAQKIEQMLDTKRQLLLAISHELRSPLTRMRVAAELTEVFDNTENAKVREMLIGDIREMEQVLAELLESERLEMGTGALRRQPCDLHQLVGALLRDHFAAEDAIDVHMEDLPPLTPAPQFDAVSIKLMLKNLLANAVRHRNGKAVSLSLWRRDDAIVVEVSDRGSGVDGRHIEFLTEPFYRVDPSRQRQTGGYGLGLYLCRLVAEAHGGTMAIASEKGAGTTVTVTLPL